MTRKEARTKAPDSPAPRYIAIAMIGAAVVFSYVLAFQGKLPFPVAVGLTVLAVARTLIWHREYRRESKT